MQSSRLGQRECLTGAESESLRSASLLSRVFAIGYPQNAEICEYYSFRRFE